MKQADLDRAVARATGETVTTIKELGFLLADPTDVLDLDSDQTGPNVVDWDALELHRNEAATRRPSYEPAIA
jgi:hypothetical protein